MRINKITIKGEKQVVTTTVSADEVLKLEDSYLISGATRAVSQVHPVTLTDNHVVEIVFEDNTTWLCSPNDLDQVFPGVAASRSADESFQIPMMLENDSAERSLVGNILLKAINIFTKKATGKVVHAEVKKVAADLEKKQLENLSGLYKVDANFELKTFEGPVINKPYLLFLHGTASSTKGSFGELIGTELWKHIQEAYGSNVLAFQHESLTKSCIQNVAELVEKLPQTCTLHVISHSRGGLVGDVLSRFCNSNQNDHGFDEKEMDFLRQEGRTEDIRFIEKTNKELENKKILIAKFIRVACPAGGTTLASDRLGNFFNISFNLLGYATGFAINPVYIAFKNLIATVIDSKNDVSALPGIEAMDPSSPFIKALNSPGTDVIIDNPLSVISGNCKTAINLKALLVIASKLFYQRDNDLVVNTNSMYQGTKRLPDVQYFFDDDVNVDHFHYFKNASTNTAILRTLQASDNKLVEGFSKLKPSMLADRNALLNLDGGEIFTDKVTGLKPIVVLLPGIMGSNIRRNNALLWINYKRFLIGELKHLDVKGTGFKATSLIRTSYKDFVDFLSADYDVVTFPFDWRLQLNQSADLFKIKMEELLKFNQPIKIVGHSMGGVLVRDFIVRHRSTWDQLNQSPKFRLLFLGAPLGGSYRIPAVLFGQDSIINSLAKVDLFHSKKQLVRFFCNMPGILSLLPFSKENDNDFALTETWETLKKGAPGDWPIPLETALTEFKKYRKDAENLFDNIETKNITYIAGKDKATPCGYRVDDTSNGKELVFLSTAEGDQSVTWESGIPKKLIGDNSVFYVDVTHGALANNDSIFKGIAEILAGGDTNLLSKTRPTVRSTQKVFRSPVQESFDISEEGLHRTILGLEPQEKQQARNVGRLSVSVSNGDLRYASYPVLAGHFSGDGILNAEKAINNYLDGQLEQRNNLTVYPGEIGTSEIFISDKEDFTGAVIVGLGKPGELTASDLGRSCEQAFIKYLLYLNKKPTEKNTKIIVNGNIGISSLIIGCDYGGLSIESSLTAIITGIQNANSRVRKLINENAFIIQHIEFIEQYDDTALNCLYALNRIYKRQDRFLNILIEEKHLCINKLLGSKRQIQKDIQPEWWRRLTVSRIENEDAKDKKKDHIHCFEFRFSTGGAREEQRKLYTNTSMVQEFVEDISVNNRWSDSLARTIFELLIPNDFKLQMKSHSNISWIVDVDTAPYPWELLRDTTVGAKPLCVSAGMIRQYKTDNYRIQFNAVTKKSALVIADPNLKGFANQLQGAKKEGELVIDLLKGKDFLVTKSQGDEAPAIIEKIFRDEYKIMHLAGHGVFNIEKPANSGMLIGNDIYLSTREIEQMSNVPELVFVNCCFLGEMKADAEKFSQSRYKLAANIGTQLIAIGVKAVIVAGWAIDDQAALRFTEVFYEGMFNNDTFGEAILNARRTIYDEFDNTRNNTWGAYQCYGDPFYKLNDKTEKKYDKANYKPEFIIDKEAEITLYNLHNELETNKYSREEYNARLEAISKEVDRAGIRNAEITQKEALIYMELGMYDLSKMKFEELLENESASYAVFAIEKYYNVCIKKVVADFLKNKLEIEKSPGTKASRDLAIEKIKQTSYAEVVKVIKKLDILYGIGETSERASLLGSAYKRKAFLTVIKKGRENKKSKENKKEALAQAALYYQKSYTPKSGSMAYSITNWLEMENILILAGYHTWEQTVVNKDGYSYQIYSFDKAVNKLNQKLVELENMSTKEMKYWDLISDANIKLSLALLNINTTGSTVDHKKKLWDEVIKSYRKVWSKAGSLGKQIAEIEHLELLSDALSLSTVNGTKDIKERIDQFKEELKKMIKT